MLQTTLETNETGHQREKERLAALYSVEILDTPSEPAYDTITRLAAEYLHADSASISFADESRVWMKSCWGQVVRELPRQYSIFDLVLASNGPLLVPDVSLHSFNHQLFPHFKHLGMAASASVPVRSSEGQILGLLNVFFRKPVQQMPPNTIRTLESLAEMVASQLELRKLRKSLRGNAEEQRRAGPVESSGEGWPSPADLHEALERGQFVLYYQPEIDLVTRKIVGLEALIRWVHPERGVIPPMEFIPQAEESGLILPIGDWGLAEACRQIQRWCQEDIRYGSLRVCVNLSARQFARKGLADHIEALLMQSGISSRQLGLEMTESSLIPNVRTALTVLGSLRRLGVTLLVDDFGTGYSSLNHLHSFPFDVLKIDRSFVGRMTEGEQPLQIVRTIIELARVMGMDVVAEGIETPEQYRLLREMRCRFGQGYLFARPMTAEAVTQLLRLAGRVLPDPEASETAGR
jgi:EAL domain-containing protein (putative c-di-GMP-specific phosphodiesterase class I)